MKMNLIIGIGLLMFCMACDNSYLIFSNDYKTENDRSSQRSESSSNKGVAFYFIKDYDHQLDVNLDSIQLESEPFISYENIVAYDSAAHIFQFDFDESLSSIEVAMINGKGFVVMVDGEKIFNGVLVSPISSFSVDAITLTVAFTDTLSGQCFELMKAYPSSEYSSSDVILNDERLILILAADGKLRTLTSVPKAETEPEPLPSYMDTMYYQKEIFDVENLSIYGKWKLESISGGFTGNGYGPDFDYLEFIPFGIYQFVRADTLLEFGRVAIGEQRKDVLLVTLKADNNSTLFFSDSEKYIDLIKAEQLNLNAPCCDRYNYHFKRME